MSRYRKISVRMWGDEGFRSLSPLRPSGQGLWVYLLTGAHTSIVPGLSAVRLVTIAEELRWPFAATRKAWQEIVRAEMAEADWVAGMVWLPRAVAHNRPESLNVAKGWGRACDDLPECPLRTKAVARLTAWLREALGEAFACAFTEGLTGERGGPSPNQEQEQEHEQEHDGKPAGAERQPSPLKASRGPRTPAPAIDADLEARFKKAAQ